MLIGNLQTCKRAHEAAQTSEVQYSILLDVCEMVDSGSSLPISERLERLRSYERAWSTLSWTENLEVPLSSLPAISSHQRDGVFASLERAPRDGCFRVVCHRWSSLLRGVAYKTWAWTFLGPVNDNSVLRIDPKNDLAVILSHVRTDSGETQTRYVWRLLCPTKAVSDHFLPQRLSVHVVLRKCSPPFHRILHHSSRRNTLRKSESSEAGRRMSDRTKHVCHLRQQYRDILLADRVRSARALYFLITPGCI
jgi:hypothetical protein